MCPWALHVVSVHAELTLGHLRYRLTDVPPQSNSPSDSVLGTGCRPVAPALAARDSPACTENAAAAVRRRHTREGTPALDRRRFAPFEARKPPAPDRVLQGSGKLALHSKRKGKAR